MKSEEEMIDGIVAAIATAFPGSTVTFGKRHDGGSTVCIVRRRTQTDKTGEGPFSINASGRSKFEAIADAMNTMVRWAAEGYAHRHCGCPLGRTNFNEDAAA